ncbi:MAG TPA: glycosyltransferase domain-containing protein [Bauldia sp.]|nr:glycosyltransferase domain-containing protein [Bauldia sp.]
MAFETPHSGSTPWRIAEWAARALGVTPAATPRRRDRGTDLAPARQRRIVREYRQTKGRHNRVAVVVTISGGYDALILPHRPLPNADYICITDLPQNNWGMFEVEGVGYQNADPTRRARYVKSHLPDYLPEYDFAIWVDANILVTADLTPLLDTFIKSGEPMGAVYHLERRSVFEEGQACKLLRRDDPETIDRQMARYRAEGFDCDDLIDSSIFMAALCDPGFQRFTTKWAAEIESNSRRDQLSLNYAQRCAGIRWHPLFKRGTNFRNQPGFRYLEHGRTPPSDFAAPARYLGSVVDPMASGPPRRARTQPAIAESANSTHISMRSARPMQ